MKNFVYHNQILYHKPCFNLFILHDNLFDKQGSEISKNYIFCTFRHTVFIIHVPPFINHLKITLHSQKVPLKQKSNHFIVECLS